MFFFMFGAGDRKITLGELRRSGRTVYCRCKACHHESCLAPRHLIERLGSDLRVISAARHLRCSRCGSKNVVSLPGERPKHPFQMPPPPERS